MTVIGDLTQTESGVISIEIGGPASSEFDQLSISGTAALGGLLNIELLNGFVPGESDSFAFLTAAALSGSFERVMVGGGGTFDVTAAGGSLVLTNYEVPEPSAALVTAVMSAAMLLRRRRLTTTRRHARQPMGIS